MYNMKMRALLSVLLACMLIFASGIVALAEISEPEIQGAGPESQGAEPAGDFDAAIPDSEGFDFEEEDVFPAIAGFEIGLAPVPVSLFDAVDSVTAVTNSGARAWTDAAAYAAKQRVVEQPLQGYFTHNFPGTAAVSDAERATAVAALANREFQVYIPKHAPQRAYVTVIGVPDGIAANEFLYEQGWFDLADEYGEMLVVLLPGPGGWGTPAEEKLYINAVVGMDSRLDANGAQVPNTNGIFGIRQPVIYLSETTTFPAIGNIYIPLYFVGYGEACAPLEAHTSYVPENVIAQAFIGGTSAGSGILSESARRVHAGRNNGLFNIGYDDDVFRKQLQSIVDSDNPYIGGQKATTDFITNADIPVPTLLAGAGYAEGANPSLAYWKSVNHTVDVPDSDGLYRERIDNGAWATHYANENIKRWNPGAEYGVSKVQTTNDTGVTAAQIRDFLAEFSRMNNFTAYSDNINYRLPYQELNVTARAYDDHNAEIAVVSFTKQDGAEGRAELRAHEQKDVAAPQSGPDGGGAFHLAVFAYEDRDAAALTDGTLDGREVYIYVPNSAKGKGPIPAVYGVPGTQNGSIQYFNATQWWSVADDEGFAVVIFGQDYANRASGSPQGVSEMGMPPASCANYTLALKELIKSGELDIGAEIDWGRFYASGYSAGAWAINSIAISGANLLDKHFAALYNHSIMMALFDNLTAELMPTYFAIASPEGVSLLSEPWALNVADTASGSSIIAADPQSGVYNSIKYLTAMNGIDFSFEATGDLEASRQSYIDSVEALGGRFWQDGRYINTDFANWQGVGLVKFTRVLGREHNFLPEEMRIGWEFMRRFRADPDTGDRYYSPSAFKAAGDEIKLVKNQPLDDQGVPARRPSANGGSGQTAAPTGEAPVTVSKASLSYISGADRVLTSVAISRTGWTSADTVILAPGANGNLADALAVAPLASQEKAPVLLGWGDRPDPAVVAELNRLGAKKIIAVGALSQNLINALRAQTSDLEVETLRGSDRLATALLVGQKVQNPKGLVVVGYEAMADAVSIASWAAANNYLVQPAGADGTFTGDASLGGYILGGPALVKDIPGFTRIYGADRYATNKAIRDTLKFEYDIVYTTDGAALADALAGAALAAQTVSPIVLLPEGDPAGVDFTGITDNTKIYSFGNK